MIATHNIKVNGRWIHAGEEYGTEKPEAPKKPAKAVKTEAPVAEAPVDVPEAVAEEKQEAKPKTSTRRKKISE